MAVLLVYCEHITPRIDYIVRFMLHTLCGYDVAFTTDAITYRQHNGPTLNYSHNALRENDFELKPNGLLQLQSAPRCAVRIRQEGETVQLFLKAPGVDDTLFDPFAAAFYLITRYEEYFPFTADAHNRFEASASVLHPHNLLYRPLIDEWAASLAQTFSKAHMLLPAQTRHFSYKISVDVDQAFAFRHRGLAKNTTALLKNLSRVDTAFLKSQAQAMLFKKDPYDTFAYLQQVQERLGFRAIYFINAGAPSRYDKNLPLTHGGLKKLLNRIKTYADIGIHPSYFSDAIPEKMEQEKRALETTIQQPVTQSRQHYLKLYFPDTYRKLLHAGITEDYSMGYAAHPGFRAGTCTPFLWFDLERNECTGLKVFPITYMEGTFGEDQALTPEFALAEMKTLTDTVRRFNGCLIPIWHNHTVNDRFSWRGWKTIFEASLQYIINPRN